MVSLLPRSVLTLRRLMRWSGAVLGMLAVSCAALAYDVAVVTSRGEGSDLIVAEALVAAPGKHQAFLAGNADALSADALGDSPLVIALGTRAAHAVLQTESRPVLVALIHAHDLEVLRKEHPDGLWTALLLDQPAERHLRLIRAILPEAQCTGMIFGPDSRLREPEFTQPKLSSLRVMPAFAASAKEVLPTLERVLRSCQAVLTLADPVVSHPTVARASLLTSYRMQRPLFGYSDGWVRAGALAAVFSTPDTITRDILEWLERHDPARPLPAGGLARHFDIAMNERVARALGIPLPSIESVRAAVGGRGAP